MTDSSGFGWGSSLDNLKEANGMFTPTQKVWSINTKELLATLFVLKSFKRELQNTNVKFFTDNTTTLSCILKRGSQQKIKDLISRKVYKVF